MATRTKYARLTMFERNVPASTKSHISVKLFVLFLAILMCFGLFLEIQKEKDVQNYAWKLEENLSANSIGRSKSSIPFISAYHMPSELRFNPDIETMMCANGTYSEIENLGETIAFRLVLLRIF